MQTADEHLRGWMSAYLGDNEELEFELTNRQSGVVRESGTTEETIEPASHLGAVAAVTDRRTLLLAGGADEDGYDDGASVPHADVAGVTVDEEFLTDRLVLTTTAGVTWRFTAREHDAMEEAVAYIDERAGGTDQPSEMLSTARRYRDSAEAADDVERTAAQFDDAVAVYRQTVELATAPSVETDFDPDALHEEIVSTVNDAIDAHLELARDARSRGNWEYGAGDTEAANDMFETALEAFERAIELSETCPPGDPAAVESKRDALLEKLEEIDVDPVGAGGD